MLLHSLVPLACPAVTVALVHVAQSYLMAPSLSRAPGPFEGNIPVLQCTHHIKSNGDPQLLSTPSQSLNDHVSWEDGTPLPS